MYTIDPKRVDLVREFEASPFGIHSAELQAVLACMRCHAWGLFHVLIERAPGGPWTVATMLPNTPPEPVGPTFDVLEDAERYVFRWRWSQITGREPVVAP